MIQGLSSPTGEAILVENGLCANTNFNGCGALRMDEHPVGGARVIESGEAMGGVGVPPLPPTARAEANAAPALAERRVRKLPITDALTA